ncbi:AIG2-like protein [Jackrogersella minutella]|nr:AIG2-like protein [Jackrogersella minutella]
MSASKPRPLFIYGTLCALPLLAWVLTGDASNISAVSRLIQPARIYGYGRFSLQNRDYPAVVKHEPHSSVDGYLLILETTSQRKRLDDFEGEAYEPIPVDVTVFDPDKKPRKETLEADIYLWSGDTNDLVDNPWELEVFERKKLKDWLDLFEGMELLSESEDEHQDSMCTT